MRSNLISNYLINFCWKILHDRFYVAFHIKVLYLILWDVDVESLMTRQILLIKLRAK